MRVLVGMPFVVALCALVMVPGYAAAWEVPFSQDWSDRPVLGAAATEAADIDRDGDVDLFVSSDGEGLFWWENDGDWTSHAFGTGTEEATRIEAGDLDGDGDIDRWGR